MPILKVKRHKSKRIRQSVTHTDIQTQSITPIKEIVDTFSRHEGGSWMKKIEGGSVSYLWRVQKPVSFMLMRTVPTLNKIQNDKTTNQ